MTKERKRVEKKPINVITPKKREEVKEEVLIKVEVEKESTILEEPKEPKQQLKFIKICEGAKQEEYRTIGERVQRGEIRLSHYAIDGSKGCYYYHLIKKD